MKRTLNFMQALSIAVVVISGCAVGAIEDEAPLRAAGSALDDSEGAGDGDPCVSTAIDHVNLIVTKDQNGDVACSPVFNGGTFLTEEVLPFSYDISHPSSIYCKKKNTDGPALSFPLNTDHAFGWESNTIQEFRSEDVTLGSGEWECWAVVRLGCVLGDDPALTNTMESPRVTFNLVDCPGECRCDCASNAPVIRSGEEQPPQPLVFVATNKACDDLSAHGQPCEFEISWGGETVPGTIACHDVPLGTHAQSPSIPYSSETQGDEPLPELPE